MAITVGPSPSTQLEGIGRGSRRSFEICGQKRPCRDSRDWTRVAQTERICLVQKPLPCQANAPGFSQRNGGGGSHVEGMLKLI